MYPLGESFKSLVVCSSPKTDVKAIKPSLFTDNKNLIELNVIFLNVFVENAGETLKCFNISFFNENCRQPC